MPYRTEWIDPDVVLQHQGAVVYHAYRDQDADQMLCFHYAVPDESEPDGREFDIRDLDCSGFDQNKREHHIEILKRAIERKAKPFAVQPKERSS